MYKFHFLRGELTGHLYQPSLTRFDTHEYSDGVYISYISPATDDPETGALNSWQRNLHWTFLSLKVEYLPSQSQLLIHDTIKN